MCHVSMFLSHKCSYQVIKKGIFVSNTKASACYEWFMFPNVWPEPHISFANQNETSRIYITNFTWKRQSKLINVTFFLLISKENTLKLMMMLLFRFRTECCVRESEKEINYHHRVHTAHSIWIERKKKIIQTDLSLICTKIHDTHEKKVYIVENENICPHMCQAYRMLFIIFEKWCFCSWVSVVYYFTLH